MRAPLILAALLWLAPLIAGAAPLAPFSAEYRIYVNKIPTPIKATLILEPVAGDDRYHMLFEAHSWLLNNREESWFRWNRCAPRTIHREFFRAMRCWKSYSERSRWKCPVSTTSWRRFGEDPSCPTSS
mgnify:CR=1 FL=1